MQLPTVHMLKATEVQASLEWGGTRNRRAIGVKSVRCASAGDRKLEISTSHHQPIQGGRLVAVDFGGDRLAVIDELLEALEHAVAWNEDAEPEPAWVIDAKAAIAIAKATQ